MDTNVGRVRDSLAKLFLLAALAPAAHAQTVSAIYDYTAPSGGFNGLTLSKAKLYGVTPSSGTGQPGTFYELIPPTSSGEPWTEKTLYQAGSVQSTNSRLLRNRAAR